MKPHVVVIFLLFRMYMNPAQPRIEPVNARLCSNVSLGPHSEIIKYDAARAVQIVCKFLESHTQLKHHVNQLIEI